jgi:hypothetical protein
MMRASNGIGKEVRVVALSLYVTTSLTLLSGIGAAATWAIAQQRERAAIVVEFRAEIARDRERDKAEMDRRIDLEKAMAKEIHDRLSERIQGATLEIGTVRGRLDSYIDRHGGR